MKTSTLKLLSFGILLIFSTSNLRADHIVGSDITYTCGDTAGIYNITYNFYRDCNGCYVLGQTPNCGTGQNCNSSFTAPTALTVSCISGSSATSAGTINLTRTGIVDITPTCGADRSRCEQPCNGAFPYGIEKHTFTGRVDLRSNIKSGCCDFEISVRLSVRSVGITTGQRSQTFYTSCEINACQAPCNNSPTLSNDPVAILCCNQPYTFNNGAIDVDRDSISYSFAQAFQGQGQPCTYSGKRTYLDPLTTYYPGRLKWPYCNAQANPPIGTCLDAETGDIVFTPTSCSEVGVVVIQITEWRKDSLGVYKKIGTTRRDMQFIVMTCPDNNAPEVKGPYSYSVCEGDQLCFNVETDDKVYIPPPPALPAAPDTVTNSWNKGISGATYTIINPTARLQTGRFCWTPGVGTASNLPYRFTVTARDDACPLNAVAVRSFSVRVKPRDIAERLIDTLDCGWYSIESKPNDGFQGTPSYQWTLLDSNRNLIFDRKIASFKSSGNFLSNSKTDSIRFRTGGTYIIQHDINNSPINCPSTFFDTIVVPPLLEVDLSLGQDTFVCAGTELTFKPFLKNAKPPITYQWSTMGVTDDGEFLDNVTSNPTDILDSFVLSVPGVQYDTAVSVIITDNIGCTAEDSVQVFLKANPIAILPPDTTICTYQDVTLVPNLDLAFWVDRELGDTLIQGDTLEKEWFYTSEFGTLSIEDSITVNKEGFYVLRVRDSLNCQDTDTFYLAVNDTVTALAGLDQVQCAEDLYTITAGGADTADKSKSHVYTWSNITPGQPPIQIGNNDAYDRIADQDSTYRLELYQTEDGVTCYDDDTMQIFVNQLPDIALGSDEQVCCDAGLIQLNFKINTPTGRPTTGGWSSTEFPYLIDNNIFYIDSACGLIDTDGGFKSRTFNAVYTYQEPSTQCINSDSIEIRVSSLPTLILDTNYYCQDIESFSLDDELVVSPANTSLGTPSWECIQCNGNDFNTMLENRGPSFAPDYWLNIDEATYTLQNPDRDTVILRFTYINENGGCKGVDSTEFYIWRVPVVEFDRNRDLCFDEGEIKLDSLTGVNLTDGIWSCYDTLGFETCNLLGGIAGDTINTTASVDDDVAHTWMMRYYHDLTGCPAWNFIPVTINPLPVINITPFADEEFCETSPAVALNASPAGGDWSNPEDPASILTNSQYAPQSAQVFNQFTTIFYNYISPTTGCANLDSTRARTDQAPSIEPIPSDEFCRQQGQTSVDLTYNLEASNSNNISWFANNPRASVSPYSATDDEILTLNLQNQSSDTFRIVIFADALSLKCNSVDDFFDVIVHPIPDATITNSNPADCNPVDTDLDLVMNNDVDITTSQFDWQLGEGGTATTQSAAATYTTDGANPITVTVTSEHGCDTTLSSNVDVYPIPVANFTPSPNNYTTAALPRFVFNDSSRVQNILGADVVGYSWDFGDPNDFADTSNEENTFWLYPADTGVYNVTLEVTTNHGCTNSTTRSVIIGPDLIVFIPNAFTPDGAGPDQNEGFSAVVSGHKNLQMIVFNRWGEIMFETNETESGGSGEVRTKGWDGNYKAEPVQQDVYAYVLKVTALNDEVYTYTGTISLVR